MIKNLFVFSGEIFPNSGHLGVITGMKVTIEKVNLTNDHGFVDKFVDNGGIGKKLLNCNIFHQFQFLCVQFELIGIKML